MIKRVGGAVLTGYFGLALVATLGLKAYWHDYKSKPVQPIEFPHVKHVQVVGLKCTDCHQYVDKGKHAGIPPMSKCMSCHESAATDRPGVQKLTKYWKNEAPIPWSKVHNLPPFVYFSHKRHVKFFQTNRGIQPNDLCKECHGQVKEMTTVRQVRSLTMGWCVSCHRQNGASVDCYTCHK